MRYDNLGATYDEIHPPMTKPRAVYRRMTEEEERMAHAVMFPRVNYLPGSPDKRFSMTMGYTAENPPELRVITESQADYLRRMVWRYRRQLPEPIRALVPAKPAVQKTPSGA